MVVVSRGYIVVILGLCGVIFWDDGKRKWKLLFEG